MGEALPQFGAPPVVETVLGIQFARLPKFNAPMAGWFWRSELREEWTQAIEVVRLEDQFETFEDEKLWGSPITGIKVQNQFDGRVQIIRKDQERMIQLQDSRLILNWQKQDQDYPSYISLLAELRELVPKFESFCRHLELGELDLNQWEVTYVNHIPKGKLWNDVSDWHRVLPQFYPPSLPIPSKMESRAGDWRFVLGENRGRLYISTRHAQTQRGEEVIALTLTARGPVGSKKEMEAGLSLGHESIVRSFTAITSEEAHGHWKRRA